MRHGEMNGGVPPPSDGGGVWPVRNYLAAGAEEEESNGTRGLEAELFEHVMASHAVVLWVVHRLHLLDQSQAGADRAADAEANTAGARFRGAAAVGLAMGITVALACTREAIIMVLAILALGTISL